MAEEERKKAAAAKNTPLQTESSEGFFGKVVKNVAGIVD